MDLGTPSMKYFQPTYVEMITNRKDSNAKVFAFFTIFSDVKTAAAVTRGRVSVL